MRDSGRGERVMTKHEHSCRRVTNFQAKLCPLRHLFLVTKNQNLPTPQDQARYWCLCEPWLVELPLWSYFLESIFVTAWALEEWLKSYATPHICSVLRMLWLFWISGIVIQSVSSPSRYWGPQSHNWSSRYIEYSSLPEVSHRKRQHRFLTVFF
jgi:hypothetical protein